MRILVIAVLALAAASVSGQTYRVAPRQSQIVYAMDHPAHHWTGTSHRVSGTLEVRDGHVVGGRVSAPIVSFDSGNRSRDSNMASDTEAYLYPDVVFEAQSLTEGAGDAATVHGTLTFHGVTRPVVVPVQIERTGDRVRVRGHFDVTLSEFAIEPPSLMMIKTRDWVGLDLDLVATRS